MKGNLSIYQSESRTATPEAIEVSDVNVLGIHIIVDVTVDPASASVVLTVDGNDPLSGKWYNILTSAAIADTGTGVFKVDPRLTAVANAVAKDFLPEKYRIVMTHTDGDAITYSVGINTTSI